MVGKFKKKKKKKKDLHLKMKFQRNTTLKKKNKPKFVGCHWLETPIRKNMTGRPKISVKEIFVEVSYMHN